VDVQLQTMWVCGWAVGTGQVGGRCAPGYHVTGQGRASTLLFLLTHTFCPLPNIWFIFVALLYLIVT